MFLCKAIYKSLHGYYSSFSCQHRSEWASLFGENGYIRKKNYLKYIFLLLCFLWISVQRVVVVAFNGQYIVKGQTRNRDRKRTSYTT